MKRQIVILVLICLSPALLLSAQPFEPDIRRAAEHFLAYRQGIVSTIPLFQSQTAEIESIKTLYQTDGVTVFAHVAHISPKGFVVLSASPELSPVIAYSFRHDWNPDTTQANLFYQALKRDLTMRGQALDAMSQEAIERNTEAWQDLLSEAPALSAYSFRQWPEPGATATGGWVETTWLQGAPYNNYCPIDPVTGQRSIVGCTATALAQLINYHFTVGSLQFGEEDAYVTRTRSIAIDADSTSGDFPSFNRLNGYLRELEARYSNGLGLTPQHLAALNFACAVSVEMDFTSRASAAVLNAVTLLEKFGYYSASDHWSLKEKDGTDEFYFALRENAMNALPAIMAINKPGVSHMIVCDGYNTDGYYHLNFGWGAGTPDDIAEAWYLLPDNLPAGYQFVIEAVLDIRPTAEYAPALKCEQKMVFTPGTVHEPSTVGSFTLTNLGTQPVTIDYIVTSDYFLVGTTPTDLVDSLAVVTVPPSSDLTVYVQCLPDSIGLVEGESIIAYSGRTAYLNVHLQGFGLPGDGTLISAEEVSGTWKKSTSPYYLYGAVSVSEDRTLEIEAGVHVVAIEQGSSLTVGPQAKLRALGSEQDSVRFYAFNPDRGWLGITIAESGDDDLLSYCVIRNARGDPQTGRAGALYVEKSSPSIIHSRIADNRALWGAGFYCAQGNPIIRSCIIESNYCSIAGAAFYLTGASPEISNSLVFRNESNTESAFLHCVGSSSPVFTNLTLADNVDGSTMGGLITLDNNDHVTFLNSILWSDYGDDLSIWMAGTDNSVTFSYSDIHTAHLNEDWAFTNLDPARDNYLIWGEDNIAESPRFISENGRAYVLHDDSPCIDAGNPNLLYSDPDDPANPGFALWPAKGTLRNDMGAYGGGGGVAGTVIAGGEASGKWDRHGSPYYLYGNVNIPDNARLEIGPGTEIIGLPDRRITADYGQLLALGTEQDSVIFRAFDPQQGWNGIYIRSYDNMLSHCVITGSRNSGVRIYGGVTLSHCRIHGNQATHGGGGVCVDLGDALIQNCKMTNNRADYGGAIYLFVGSVEIVNTLIYGNTANQRSSFLDAFENGDATVTNTTIYDNAGSLMYLDWGSKAVFNNSILWSDDPDGNLNIGMGSDSYLKFSYSDIYTTHLYDYWDIVGDIEQFNTLVWGDDNIDLDPEFAAENGKPYILQDGSPCIDAGDPSPLYNDPEDPNNPGFALWPSKGALRNDMGTYGGLLSDIPVPVEMTAFTATVEGADVVLSWMTATETDNYGFSVERSIDDTTFYGLAFVEGHATTTEAHCYTYTDRQCKPGKYAYRLKQIDTDGAFSYSPVIHATVLPPSEFALSQNYPNPFNATTRIEYSMAATGKVQIVIYNILGAQVRTLVNDMQEAGVRTVFWDGADDRGNPVGSGMYIYKMRTDRFVNSKKLLLLK